MNNSEKFWDRAANTYDQEEEKDEQTYVEIIDKTREYLKIGDVVLDFGCGTGHASNEIAGNVKVIHAIDTSSKMIERAKQKADARKIENVDYAHSTIFDARYGIGSFDVVLAFYILHLLEDTHEVMQRIHELLKPGGLIISVTPCLGEKKTLNILLSMLSKVGLVPNVRSFKVSELEASIANGNFQIVETECLRRSSLGRSQEHFIVAKRN
jgi:2-polyprenyl-3-methyl-5-hydroxy-6-metoxy-1,4-benzoquinol methylase